jgi:hypothetical protein
VVLQAPSPVHSQAARGREVLMFSSVSSASSLSKPRAARLRARGHECLVGKSRRPETEIAGRSSESGPVTRPTSTWCDSRKSRAGKTNGLDTKYLTH